MTSRLSVALFGFLLFMSQLLLASSPASAQTEGLSVRIISAPPDGGGSDILGQIRIRVEDPQEVCGQDWANCRLAIFSLTDAYYPQPTLANQMVYITDGLVEERIHLGHSYSALVVRPDNYPMQPAKIWSLPTRLALAKDEAPAGTERPESASESTLSLPTVAAAGAARPGAGPQPREHSIDNSGQSLPAKARNSVVSWFGPVVVLILLWSVFLVLSRKVEEFCKALALSLTQLIEVPESRLRALTIIIDRTDRKIASAFIAAAIFLLLAVGLAAANFLVVKFSLELFLSDFSFALTTLAVALVLLKCAAGMMLHFLKGRVVKFVIVVALIATSVCGATLAYKRGEAMQLDKSAASVNVAASESGVLINEGVLGVLPTTDPQAATASPSTTGSWLMQILSKEPAFVAALAVILDIFEIICVFSSFQLSSSVIIWLTTLPLVIAREVLGFAKKTQLMDVVGILAAAALTSVQIIATELARAIRLLFVAAPDIARKVAGAIRKAWSSLRCEIRRLRERRIEHRNFLERLRILESEKVTEVRALRDQADDLRQSVRVMKQAENKFNQSELSRALGHREQMNELLRRKTTAALAKTLENFEALTMLIGDKLMADAEKRAGEYSEARSASLAEGTTEAVALQAEVMNKMGTSLNGFYPPKTPTGKANKAARAGSANFNTSKSEGGLS